MTFCQRRIVSIIGSLIFGFCSLLVLSTLESGHLGVCLLGFCTLGNPCTCYSVNWGLFQGLVVFTLYLLPFGFVYLWLCQNRTFLIGILSTLHFVHLVLCRLGLCLVRSLAIWHSLHLGLCPLLVLSTLEFAHVWFCLLWSLATWVFVYLDFVHLETRAHVILSIEDCFKDCLYSLYICSLLVLSTCDYVQTGLF